MNAIGNECPPKIETSTRDPLSGEKLWTLGAFHNPVALSWARPCPQGLGVETVAWPRCTLVSVLPQRHLMRIASNDAHFKGCFYFAFRPLTRSVDSSNALSAACMVLG